MPLEGHPGIIIIHALPYVVAAQCAREKTFLQLIAQSLGHDEIGHVIISIWLDLVEPERTDHADPKDILAAMACKERRILDVAVMRHDVVDGHLAHLRRAVGQRL